MTSISEASHVPPNPAQYAWQQLVGCVWLVASRFFHSFEPFIVFFSLLLAVVDNWGEGARAESSECVTAVQESPYLTKPIFFFLPFFVLGALVGGGMANVSLPPC